MKKTLTILFVSVAFALSAVAVTPVSVADSVVEVGTFVAKKVIDTKIIPSNNSITVSSSEKIEHIEIYSAIGGLLFSSKIDRYDIKIEHLPRSIVVVRLKHYNQNPQVYKVSIK